MIEHSPGLKRELPAGVLFDDNGGGHLQAYLIVGG
jgi:hypothetical protein